MKDMIKAFEFLILFFVAFVLMVIFPEHLDELFDRDLDWFLGLRIK